MDKGGEILRYIRSFRYKTGIFPSVREIAGGMGFRSSCAVDYWIKKLEARGDIVRVPGAARWFEFPNEKSSHADVCPTCGRAA
jgi:SOS-response transcriptional repressor LexA